MKSRIKIHLSFFLFFIAAIAFGQVEGFIIAAASAIAHESAHILMAKLFGLKADRVLITPIGETAYINGLDSLDAKKKAIVLLAGPVSNFFIAAIFYLCRYDELFLRISMINAALGIFNILPIYPFDGGRILFLVLGNIYGILKGARTVKLFTRLGIAAMFSAGFIQLVLFPFNISLIAIAFFLTAVFKREEGAMVFSYYRCMIGKADRLKKGIHTKSAAFSSDAELKAIINIFTWDFYHIIYIIDNGKILASFTEKQIFEAVTAYDTCATATAYDIINRKR